LTERTAIDKTAAGRFIKRAITQAKSAAHGPSDNVSAIDSPAGPSTFMPVPVKMTSKMLERVQYEKEMRERDENGSEDDQLEVFVDEEGKEQSDGMAVDDEVRQVVDVKGKGKARQEDPTETTQVGNKRRRPAIDPFAGKYISPSYSSAFTDDNEIFTGYGDDLPEANDESVSKKTKSEDLSRSTEPTHALPSNKTSPKVRRGKKHVAAALAKNNSASQGVALPESSRTSTPGGNFTDVDALESNEVHSGQNTPGVNATAVRKGKKKRSKKAT